MHRDETSASQMSVAVTETEIGTFLPLGGQIIEGLAVIEVMVGGFVSLTTTLVVQVLELLDASVTRQLTAVVPSAKLPPEPLQVGVPTPEQLSVAVAARVAGGPVGDVHSVTTVAGQVILGTSASSTSTFAAQAEAIWAERRSVSVTRVLPFEYGPAGEAD